MSSAGTGRDPAETRRLRGLPAYRLAGIPEVKARLQAEGRDVIDLGAGDCGLPVPEQTVATLREACARPDLQRYTFQRTKNPTAAVAQLDYVEEMIGVTADRGALLVYDNAYAEIAFDGFRPPSLLEIDGGLENGIEFHSSSKSFNMTERWPG